MNEDGVMSYNQYYCQNTLRAFWYGSHFPIMYLGNPPVEVNDSYYRSQYKLNAFNWYYDVVSLSSLNANSNSPVTGRMTG